jgi:hypothetical protein
MTRWVEPVELLRLVRRDFSLSGSEPVSEVILRESSELIPVSEPGLPPLDIHTYRVRLSRWQAGEGPDLTGIQSFVDTLESLQVSARAVSVRGTRTSHVFLLDADLTRVLAGLAIDPPVEDFEPL